MEIDFIKRYENLRNYLNDYLHDQPQKRPSSAMQKVSRLPQEQFTDVSTDLNDELDRRINRPEIPFLEISVNLLPKRNQARQKMATLPTTRFKELAAELMFEIEKRYPAVIEQYMKNSREEGRKRTTSLRPREAREPREPRERNSRERGSRDGSARSSDPRDRSISSRDVGRDQRYNSFKSEEPDQTESNLRSDYEFKIAMLEKQMKDGLKQKDILFQIEKDELVDANSKMKAALNKSFMEYDDVKSSYDKQSIQLEQLKVNIDSFKGKLDEKSGLLSRLEKRNTYSEEENLELKAKIIDLQKIISAKHVSPHQQAAIPNQQIVLQPKQSIIKEKVPSPVIQSPASSIQTVKDLPDPNPESSFEKFERISLELLQSTKSSNRASVLGPMKTILLTCKQITQDSESIESKADSQDRQAIQAIKSKLSESLSLLMQAAKDHASKAVKGSEDRIESQLQSLSFCVNDLSELVKVVNRDKSALKRETLRLDEPLPPLKMSELLDYVEEQIDDIAHSIQYLLKCLKEGESVNDIVGDVSQSVDNIVYETGSTIDLEPLKSKLASENIDYYLEVLGDLRNELLDLGEDFVEKPDDSSIKQKVANSSYEIVKNAKELLGALEQT